MCKTLFYTIDNTICIVKFKIWSEIGSEIGNLLRYPKAGFTGEKWIRPITTLNS
jgi:hypothetical protein